MTNPAGSKSARNGPEMGPYRPFSRGFGPGRRTGLLRRPSELGRAFRIGRMNRDAGRFNRLPRPARRQGAVRPGQSCTSIKILTGTRAGPELSRVGDVKPTLIGGGAVASPRAPRSWLAHTRTADVRRPEGPPGAQPRVKPGVRGTRPDLPRPERPQEHPPAPLQGAWGGRGRPIPGFHPGLGSCGPSGRLETSPGPGAPIDRAGRVRNAIVTRSNLLRSHRAEHLRNIPVTRYASVHSSSSTRGRSPRVVGSPTQKCRSQMMQSRWPAGSLWPFGQAFSPLVAGCGRGVGRGGAGGFGGGIGAEVAWTGGGTGRGSGAGTTQGAETRDIANHPRPAPDVRSAPPIHRLPGPAEAPDPDRAGLSSGGDRGAKDRGGTQLGPRMPIAPPARPLRLAPTGGRIAAAAALGAARCFVHPARRTRGGRPP